MGRSLGLALYLVSAGRGGARVVPADWPPRPAGALVWFDAGGAASLAAARPLARALRRLRPGLTLLVTWSGAIRGGDEDAAEGIIRVAAPADRTAEARAFLGHWRPDAAVFSEGHLPPALIHAADTRGVPLFLVNGRVPLMPGNSWRNAPGLMASILGRFRAAVMTDATGLRYARRAGAPADAVEAAGWLDEAGEPPGVTEPERAALSRLVGTRPLWLAIGVPEAEEAAVLAAHRAALRLTHRLLLILVPAEPGRGPALAARAAGALEGGAALRSAEEYPAEQDAVYVADTEGEDGLWYRLAPVCFLGGSLAGAGPTRSPAEAALLGAAILGGPRRGSHAGLIARLEAAGGAEAVPDAAGLAAAVGMLIAADRAAARALAAWGVVTAGAEVTGRVARQLVWALPAAGPGAAGPGPGAAGPEAAAGQGSAAGPAVAGPAGQGPAGQGPAAGPAEPALATPPPVPPPPPAAAAG